MVNAGFARLIANIMVMGGGIFGRAFMDAYKHALQNGGTAARSASRRGGGIAASEARSILNVKPDASPTEVSEAYQRLYGMNDPAKGGSEYLRSKIQNAHDHLEDLHTQAKSDGKSETK